MNAFEQPLKKIGIGLVIGLLFTPFLIWCGIPFIIIAAFGVAFTGTGLVSDTLGTINVDYFIYESIGAGMIAALVTYGFVVGF